MVVLNNFWLYVMVLFCVLFMVLMLILRLFNLMMSMHLFFLMMVRNMLLLGSFIVLLLGLRLMLNMGMTSCRHFMCLVLLLIVIILDLLFCLLVSNVLLLIDVNQKIAIRCPVLKLHLILHYA
jgi:hypothetical protein